jgi:hypothetical protein
VQEAAAFIRRVLAAEHAARSAALIEPDYERFRERWEALEALGDFPGLGATIYRAPESALPPRQEADRTLRRTGARRRQMVGEMYEHPERGMVYVATVTTTFSSHADGVPQWRAAVRLTAARTAGGWRITTWENACSTCETTGVFRGRPCPECGGVGWELTGGMRLKGLEGPIEVLEFENDDLVDEA